MAMASINAAFQNLVIDPSDPFKNLTREVEVLDFGTFGRVYRCLSRTDGKVKCVVKEVDIPRKEPRRSEILKTIDQEYIAITTLEKMEHHPNIIRILHCNRSDLKLLVFMEYMEGGDLASYVGINGKQDQSTALRFLQQIANGLMYLHSHGIAHYDLKSNNILLDNAEHPNVLKITDYGTSKVFSTGNATTVGFKGTVPFMAPEVYAARDNHNKKPDDQTTFNKFSEIWSLGVIVLHLVTGLLNWNIPGEVQSEVNNYIRTAQRGSLIVKVLEMLLVIDPQNRCDLNTAMKLITNKLPEVICVFRLSLLDKPGLKDKLTNHFTNHNHDDNAIQVAVQIIKTFDNHNWFVVSCNNDDDVSSPGWIKVKVDDRQHLFYWHDNPTWQDATEETVKTLLNSIKWTTESASDVHNALNNHFSGVWRCIISSNDDTIVYNIDINVKLNNGIKFISVYKFSNY